MDHAHSHAVSNIRLAFFLNLLFTVVSLGGGYITNSQAVMAESVHNLGCTTSLGLAWLFQSLSRKSPSESYNFGYSRHSLIGAFINGIVIAISSLVVAIEGIDRIVNPDQSDVHVTGMLALAVVGIVFKGVAMMRTRSGKGANERMVSLHMLSDTMGWTAVFIAGIVLFFVPLPMLDPALSIGIAVYIFINAINELLASIRIALNAAPRDFPRKEVLARISMIPGVSAHANLIVWSQDGESVSCILQASLQTSETGAVRQAAEQILKESGVSTVYFDIK